MRTRGTVLALLLAAGPILGSRRAPAAVNALALWSRKHGNFTDDANPARVRPMSIDFSKHKLVKRALLDAQTGHKATFRGVGLDTILKSYHPDAKDDLALLHFANGMVVPLPLDAASLTRLSPFLALEYCPDKEACSTEFPSIGKDDAFSVTDDPRPITFSWNKLVVASEWHPDVPQERAALFSPWRHADTLTGVEFVNAAAYYRQFDAKVEDGEAVFKERCQFCHGVRQVGATFGWDFATPLALYEKRSPAQLLNHVKYPKVRAKTMGLMMPNQKDVTLPEMQALWRWMRLISTAKRLPSYQP